MNPLLSGPVTYDSKSFLVGGKRIWLHCGEIHYFRHPHRLWFETLQRARQAGLNSVATVIPWNWHEPVEGQVDFHGLLPEQERPTAGRCAQPSYLSTTFARPPGQRPVFLQIGSLHKGQIFVNGHHVGRFWQVGGYWQGNGVQDRYYLPRPWLAAQNRLVIFAEYGLAPDGVSLVWGDASAWGEQRL